MRLQLFGLLLLAPLFLIFAALKTALEIYCVFNVILRILIGFKNRITRLHGKEVALSKY